MKIILSIIFTLIGLAVIFLIAIYSGRYNVSAMKQEAGISKWILNTAMDKSINYHSKNIKVPSLNDPLKIKNGFADYKEMCQGCHGGPGKKETELSKGLNPPAPDLVEHAEHLSAKEIFWVTKNGIRMTGMPAWGKTHSDEKIWSMVAFMKQLPNITKEEYEKMESENENSEEHPGSSHEHTH